jgi:hypothetical protein
VDAGSGPLAHGIAKLRTPAGATNRGRRVSDTRSSRRLFDTYWYAAHELSTVVTRP